ncbi:unnamed protein product [Rhodiola kirilowii]
MGFDNECILNIQNLAGEYFCPVCRMLVYPNEALQSQCTHLYCKPCLAYIVATTRACPYDGYLVTQEDSKPLLESNKTLAETIGKIAVHCLYHRSGCTWQGALSDCSLHCSTCAFGNSPVVCNRCAMQIMHRQVQEHAQRCTGVQSQAVTAEGALSSAASTVTNQTRATVQGVTISSQNHASHTPTAVLPGQVPSHSASSNPNFPYVAQAAIPATDLPHQQQLHDPYQQHYQQYYQQHYQQQLPIQHPPLQPQPQYQSLPQQQQQQQQPPSLVQSQPQQLVQHPSLQPKPQYQSLPQQPPPSLVQIQPQQRVQHPPLQRQPQYQSLPQQRPPSLAQTQTQQQIQHHPLQPQPQYQSLPQQQPPSLVQTQPPQQVQHPPLQPQPKYQSLPQQQPASLVQTQAQQQIQHPPLQPRQQYQSLPQQQPPSLVETQTQQQIQHPPSQPQQQSPSPVQTQPPAQLVPLNQHYPQTQAMSVSSQQQHQHQQHPTVRPQFHSHFESHMVARPPLSNEPRLHPLALQPGAFPEDNRLDLRRDVLSAASMYGHHFGVPGGSPNGRHPSMSSRTILSGRGSIPPLAEVGFRSNLLLIDDLFYKDDLELSDNLRKRKVATMGWCRICKVDCDTVEGLDLHSQTREHQRMSMDMVLMIKQQNSMRQKMTSKDFDPLSRKQSRQDYLI